MSKESDDLEHTVRLDTNKHTDPYETIDENHADPFAHHNIPEGTHNHAEDEVDFNELSKEIDALSHTFDSTPHNQAASKTPASTPSNQGENTKKILYANKKEPYPGDTTDMSKKSAMDIDDKGKTTHHKIHEKKASQGMNIAMLGIAMIALAAGLAGIWASMSVQSQIDALSAQVQAIKNDPLSRQLANQQAELIAAQKQLIKHQQALSDLKRQYKALAFQQQAGNQTVQENPDIAGSKAAPTPAATTSPPVVHEVERKTPPTSPDKNTWSVVISSHDSMKKAKLAQQHEARKGMQTRIVAATVHGQKWYRIVSTGFTDKQQAIKLANQLKKQGNTDTWVQFNP